MQPSGQSVLKDGGALTAPITLLVAWLNSKMGLGIDPVWVMTAVIGPAIAYILGQSNKDAKMGAAAILGKVASSE